MSTQETKSQLPDATLEKLLAIVSHYAFAELEEIAPFDSKSDSERQDIMKIAIKAIETSVIVSNELHAPASTVNDEKIEKIYNLLQSSKFDEAYKSLKE